MCAKLLLAHRGAAPSLAGARDGDGRTAAQIAAERGHTDLALFLSSVSPAEGSEWADGEPSALPPSTRSPPRAEAAAPADGLAGLESWELTTLIELLAELGDRREPPLTPRQKGCVSKLAAALFSQRLQHPIDGRVV